MTPAILHLQRFGISFKEHRFEYLENGGTAHSSSSLGVPEHSVVKTLIFECQAGGEKGGQNEKQHSPFVVLMHGDRTVDTKKLARLLECRRTAPCDPARASRLSGYLIGGTSPFGLKTEMPIYAESTIQNLHPLYINGGARGFLVEIQPQDLEKALNVTWVSVSK